MNRTPFPTPIPEAVFAPPTVNEYVKVTEVGFSSTPTGVINDSTDVSLGIATLPVVKVERGQLGIAATSHAVNATARVHRGAFNIV